jgi:hypothetical protein
MYTVHAWSPVSSDKSVTVLRGEVTMTDYDVDVSGKAQSVISDFRVLVENGEAGDDVGDAGTSHDVCFLNDGT